MNLNEERVITTTLYKGVGVVAVTLLTGFVTGAIAFYRTSISDHFLLTSVNASVKDIKNDYVPKGEVKVFLDQYKKDTDDFKTSLRIIDSDIKSILRQK